MKMFSAVRAYFKEGQHVLAEAAMRQGKRRFIWLSGVLLWTGFGFVMGIVIEFQQRGQRQPLFAWGNIAFLLGFVLFFSFFGYLSANWKWKDYERIVKR